MFIICHCLWQVTESHLQKWSIVNQMEELKVLTNLSGRLDIKIYENVEHAKENVEEGGYMGNTRHLNCLAILFSRGLNKMGKDEKQLLLEDLIHIVI